ncbi:MAG: phosphoserine phosphatase SerB [Parvibaculaceae bacterium]
MDSVVILIAAPGSHAIGPGLAGAVADIAMAPPRWLHEGEAVEFPLRSPSAEAQGEIGRLVRDRPVDVAVLPAANRRKRLLIADMDSTMIGQECIDELGSLAGAGERIREITAGAMRGDLDFEAALKARLALMKGLPESAIATVIRERISFTPGGRTLVATMKAHGAHAALVSGGFVQFTGHVAKALGFDEHRANELIIVEGQLTGAAREPILGKDAKLEALHELARKLGLPLADTLAVGDGANDIPMLRDAGLGVALHAKQAVREAVSVAIDHGDLTALLYLQGYRRDEFAE